MNNFKTIRLYHIHSIFEKHLRINVTFFMVFSIFSYTCQRNILKRGRQEEEAIGFHIQFVVGNDAVK